MYFFEIAHIFIAGAQGLGERMIPCRRGHVTISLSSTVSAREKFAA
jgi:hypothetical protein